MAAAARGGWCCGHPRVVAVSSRGRRWRPCRAAAATVGCVSAGRGTGRPGSGDRGGAATPIATTNDHGATVDAVATTRSRRPLRRTWTRGGGRLSRTTRSAWHAMIQRCWRGLRAASRRPRRAPTRLRRHPRFEVLADTDYRPVLAAGRCWRLRSRFEGGGGGGGWRRVGTAAGTREDVGRQGELRCQGGVGRGGVVGAQKTPQARRHFRRGATMRPTRSRLPLPVPSSPIAAPTPPRCGGLDATHAQLKLRVVLLA